MTESRGGDDDLTKRLTRLRLLRDENIITEADYEQKKRELLTEL